MKRERAIAEIADAISARLEKMVIAANEPWDCYLPPDCAEAMARAAVAIMEAYEASEKFAEREGRLTV